MLELLPLSLTPFACVSTWLAKRCAMQAVFCHVRKVNLRPERVCVLQCDSALFACHSPASFAWCLVESQLPQSARNPQPQHQAYTNDHVHVLTHVKAASCIGDASTLPYGECAMVAAQGVATGPVNSSLHATAAQQCGALHPKATKERCNASIYMQVCLHLVVACSTAGDTDRL